MLCEVSLSTLPLIGACSPGDPCIHTADEQTQQLSWALDRRRPMVMLVEDNPADVALVQEALREHAVDCCLTVVNDGERAIQHILRVERAEADLPALIVLDLNLPRRPGFEVLAAVRASATCSLVPVVILSSSMAARDIQQARELGATDYIHKPMDLEEYLTVGAMLKQMLARSAETI